MNKQDLISSLTPLQLKHLDSAKWFISGGFASGRTQTLAVAAIISALEHPGKWIKVFEHSTGTINYTLERVRQILDRYEYNNVEFNEYNEFRILGNVMDSSQDSLEQEVLEVEKAKNERKNLRTGNSAQLDFDISLAFEKAKTLKEMSSILWNIENRYLPKLEISEVFKVTDKHRQNYGLPPRYEFEESTKASH